MTLEARVALHLGDLALDVEISASAGATVAVVGPNGAGKTTLLRAVAGLMPIEEGRVVLDGDVLGDPAAGRHVLPEDRAVGFVFQDYLLFPHLSVLDNVAFGPRCRGSRRADADRLAQEQLDRLDIGDLAAARPSQISGGQAQRVALARALAASPRLLLLDEPMAALDASTRADVRLDLRRRLASFAGARVIVTHDPVDAIALAETLVVLEGGRVVQSGTPAEIASRPRSQYVADLVGVNLVRGVSRGTEIVVDGGGSVTAADAHNGRVLATIHPRAVALYPEPPEGSPRNVWAGRIMAVEPLGERVRVRVAGPPAVVAELTLAAASALALAEGQEAWVSIKATDVAVYCD